MSDVNKTEPITNKTRGSIKIQGSAYIPIVDAHMHIQGNQIAPIPIMKGILVYKAASLGSSLLANEINFFNLSYLENKEIDINILYEKKILPNPDKISLSRRGVKLLSGSVDFFSLDDDIFENRKKMLDLLAENFILHNFVADYGKITRFSSYDIAKIYINDSIIGTNSIGYANHKITYDTFDDKNYSDLKDSQCNKDLLNLIANNQQNYFYKISAGFFENTDNNKLIYQFSIVHGMELMYAHYWGAAGIPIYVKDKTGIYEVCNSAYWGNHNPLFNIYDIPDADVWKNLEKYKNEKEIVTDKTKKYIHFLKKVDSKEVYQFEDHELHVNYQKLAAYKNPFNLLPFYHIDLRRFFAPTEYIKDSHSFYDFDTKKKIPKDDNELKDFMDQFNGESNASTNGVAGFKLKLSFDGIKKYFITESDENLDDNTLFWGIKMYVALGCPPYYGLDEKLTKKVFPMLEGKDLSRLRTDVENFYNYCIEKDIPITCHGSPQGMTIADPGVYLKEYLKLNKNNKIPYNFAITANSYIQGLGLIDDFSSPYSWEIVLKKYPNLRLCIAHFGGSRFFDGTFYSIDDNPPCYSWQSKIKELVEKYQNVYTDISCYTFDAGKKHCLPLEELKKEANEKNLTIYELIWQKGEKIDTYVDRLKQLLKKYKDCDIPYTKDIKNAQTNIYYRIYKTAKSLIELLKDDGTLKDKIMYGTDWPMFETSEKLDTYQGNLYAVLKLVTLKLGNKWNAWYRFAVINPLRFLNLIEDNGSGYVFSSTGRKKLENYKKALELMSKNVKNIAKKSHIKYGTSGLASGDDYKGILNGIYGKIKTNWFDDPNYIIPYSEDIIKN